MRNAIRRWWRRLFNPYSRSGRPVGIKNKKTLRSNCRYSAAEWAQLKAATPKDLRRLAREFGRSRKALVEAYRRVRRTNGTVEEGTAT